MLTKCNLTASSLTGKLELMNTSLHLKAICWFRCSHFKEFPSMQSAFQEMRVHFNLNTLTVVE